MAEEVVVALPRAIEVRHESGVGEARRCARSLALALGFSPNVAEEIALVATELATNLIKHAAGGTLTLTPLEIGGRVGMEIGAADSGPGIANVEQALADRFSTAGSRGTGLGAVNRLMDELEITSNRGAGTRIVCRRWRREHRASSRPCPLAIGVATRPLQIGQANGDAFVVNHWAESLLVGVIDGLGHGRLPTAPPGPRKVRGEPFRSAAGPDLSRRGPRLPRDPRRGDGSCTLRLGPGPARLRLGRQRRGPRVPFYRPFNFSFVAASSASMRRAQWSRNIRGRPTTCSCSIPTA